VARKKQKQGPRLTDNDLAACMAAVRFTLGLAPPTLEAIPEVGFYELRKAGWKCQDMLADRLTRRKEKKEKCQVQRKQSNLRVDKATEKS